MINFHEIRFPEDVSWGSRGGPTFKTQVFTSHRGFEKRNLDWMQPIMHFDVSYGIRQDSHILAVINFFNARQGRAHGFRYKNWGNYKLANEPFAAGDGANNRLPIWKMYNDSVNIRSYKRLYKIVQGSVTGVTVAGVPATEGTDFSIDYNSGEIAFNTVQPYGTLINCVTLEFDEPVRFDMDNMQTVIDAYNSNSISAIPLVGIRDSFTSGTIFAPGETSSANDEFYASTNLIMKFDDVANPATTVDQSALANALTIVAPGTLTTTDYSHGVGSFSPGATGYISAAATNFDFGSAPFTIELFAKRPTTGGEAEQHIISRWEETGNQRSWDLRYFPSSHRLEFIISTDGTDEVTVLSYPWSETTGSFDYITVDRLVNGWYVLRINGIVLQSSRNNSTLFNSTALFTLGGLVTPGVGEGSFNNLIDSSRVTVGRSRHAYFERVDVPTHYNT